MHLRGMRRALRSGDWVLVPEGKVTGGTEFQKTRLTEAVSAARIYLEGNGKVGDLAKTFGVTPERAAQVVRLGVKWMVQAGWLRLAEVREPKPELVTSR